VVPSLSSCHFSPPQIARLPLIHLSSFPRPPLWIGATLRQARIFNDCDIVLVAEAAALKAAALPAELRITQATLADVGLSPKRREFQRFSPFDRSFREGFWTFTSERFFVAEAAAERFNLRNILHIENDVMLYCSANELAAQLSQLYPGIAATFHNDTCCIPGLMYFPDQRALAAVTQFYLRVLTHYADIHPTSGGGLHAKRHVDPWCAAWRRSACGRPSAHRATRLSAASKESRGTYSRGASLLLTSL
jgi:hypothetical protein